MPSNGQTGRAMIETPPRATRAQLLGVTLGNALEFYDFLVFSFFAVQIGQCFFPAVSPQTSLLAALATFGVGFLARPLGALVIGGLGDRIGRRPMLLLSFALIGLANLGVAVTPSFAALGYGAPLIVLACRLVQGFALGGEVGASTAFLAEVSEPARRGRMIALQFVGQGAALVAGGVIGVALATWLDDTALAVWGWRVAMGIGVLIVPIGLVLRGTLPETLRAQVPAPDGPPPRYGKLVLFALTTMLSGTVATYVLNYMTTYAKTVLKLPSSVSFGATIAVGAGFTIGAVLAGIGADRFGRRPMMLWPGAIGTALTLPGFWLLSTFPSATTLYAVSFVLRLVTVLAMTAALVSLTEAFPARIRSGAIAILYAVATSVFGGTTQFIVAWLTGVTGDPLSPAYYMSGALLLGVVAALVSKETAPGRSA